MVIDNEQPSRLGFGALADFYKISSITHDSSGQACRQLDARITRACRSACAAARHVRGRARWCLQALVGAPGEGGFAAHAAVGVVTVALSALICRCGWLAGGDVKLAAMVFLRVGPAHAWPACFVIGVGGLIVGLACVVTVHAPSRLARLEFARGVPYGGTLAASGLWGVWTPPVCRASACFG